MAGFNTLRIEYARYPPKPSALMRRNVPSRVKPEPQMRPVHLYVVDARSED